MFLREYFRVLLPLFLIFVIYQLLVVPWIEPSNLKPNTSRWTASAIPQRAQWWDVHFSEKDWQRSGAKIVKTDNAILLFQTREEISKTKWLFKPVTILIPQKESSPSSQPIIIQNTNGAEIEFKHEVEWSKEIPPIERGRLLGEITIDSPADPASKRESMHIDARDIMIDRRVIRTLQPIHLSIGNSVIEGRDLLVQLDKNLLSNDANSTKSDQPFNGLDSLQLTYVDRVEIQLENGGLWPDKNKPDSLQRRAYATLRCGGQFEFLFHSSKAILKNGVHMEHIVEGMPIDTFDCHELQMQMAWANGSNAATSKPLLGGSSSSNWKLDRLEAIGTIGQDNKPKWFHLNAPGMDSEAQGQHLVMDFDAGMVSVSNRLPGTAAREHPHIYLRREGIRVWSSEVRYWSPESVANSPTGNAILGPSNARAMNRLGVMHAAGGLAQMDSKSESWKLSWSKQLLIRPEGDLDLVFVEGSANVNSSSHGRFIAEKLYLWMAAMTPERANALSPRYPDGKLPQFVPERLNAEGSVEVQSPEIRARVENMQLWFSYAQNPQPTSSNSSNPLPNSNQANTLPHSLNLGPSTGLPSPPVKQPVVNVPSAVPPQNQFASANSPQPMHITGKSLHARLVTSGTTSYVDELQLDGSFSLTKEQASESTPWPFTAVGHSLHLRQTESSLTDITIQGEPNKEAKVKMGSGWVQAPELKLWQTNNQFFIDHPGELVIPQEVLTRSAQGFQSMVSVPLANPTMLTGTGPAKSKQNDLVWRELPRVRWGKRMVFDGSIARFGGGITIDCRFESDPSTLWHVECEAEQLALDMEQPVLLRGNANASTQHQIKSIRLEGNVDVRMVQTDHQNNRRSIEHLKLPKLELHVPTQMWMGDGPGELFSRRFTSSNPLQPLAPPIAALPSNSGSLQCIHLSYMGSLRGDTQNRTVSFFDRIEMLMGPISDWNQSVNVHRVERLSAHQSRMISDRLTIFDGSGLSWNQPSASTNRPNASAWEIESQGLVKLEASTENGDIVVEADILKYSASSDIARIAGTARQPAVVSRIVNGELQPQDLKLNSAAVRLRTGEIDGMQIQSFGGPIPANLRPNARGPSPPNAGSLPTDKNQLPDPRKTNVLQPRR